MDSISRFTETLYRLRAPKQIVSYLRSHSSGIVYPFVASLGVHVGLV